MRMQFRKGMGLLALLMMPALAQDRSQERAARADQSDRDYREGTKYLEQQQYEKALAAYNRVISEKGPRADGALYWRAYAQNRLGQRGEALATIAELRKTFADSRWSDDAKALEVEVRQAMGHPMSPEKEGDEDLKLLAINALMTSDPERSLPMLEKLLKSQSSPRLKERALFVLAQSGSPQARTVLAQTAKGVANPDLQRKAVEYLGVFGGKENRQLLVDIYKSSNDVDVKRRVLQSFMISGDRGDLLAVAKTEASPDLRMEAVRQLGISGGSNELWQMYGSESSYDVKRAILQGLFLSGNAEKLSELAHNEKDPKLRHDAIRNMGLMGRERTGDALLSLYAKETDASVKRAVVEGLFLQGNAPAIVSLARKETDPAMKRALVEKLSLMNSKEGTDYLMEMLNK